MSTCLDTPPPTGGWLVRDVLAGGTSSTDPSPVRPRSARFSEPCWNELGELEVPVQLSDVPVAILDEDEDGIDDGNPNPAGGECDGSSSLAVQQPTGTQVQAVTTSCTTAQSAYNTSGTPPIWTAVETVTVTGVPLDSDTITVSYAGLNDADNRGRVLYTWLYCKSNLGAVSSTADDSFAPNDWSTTIPSSDTLNCNTSGDTLWRIVVMQRVGNVYSGGVVWAADDIDPPATGGTGYYGGTQAAQFSIGASTAWTGVTHNGIITCSTTYAGSSPFTLDVIEKAPGSFAGPDRSPLPPEGPDDWTTTVPYIPNFTLVSSDCPYLLTIEIWVCAYADHDPSEYGCVEQEWDSERFRTDTPYSNTDGDSPEFLICEVYPETIGCYDILNPGNAEAPIECFSIPEDITDFFIGILVFVLRVPEVAACMFIPLGWDRADKITTAWERTTVGKFSTAFQDAMPSNIACGEVGSIPFYGTTLGVNTCDADFAPGWVKVAAAFVIIIGLGALSVRRVLWSLGGDSK